MKENNEKTFASSSLRIGSFSLSFMIVKEESMGFGQLVEQNDEHFSQA